MNLTVWVLVCLEGYCCGGYHLVTACQHMWSVCLQVLSLTSATCMMPLGCSCAIKVAQQNSHKRSELRRASRTRRTPGPLLCLERAEGSEGPCWQKPPQSVAQGPEKTAGCLKCLLVAVALWELQGRIEPVYFPALSPVRAGVETGELGYSLGIRLATLVPACWEWLHSKAVATTDFLSCCLVPAQAGVLVFSPAFHQTVRELVTT